MSFPISGLLTENRRGRGPPTHTHTHKPHMQESLCPCVIGLGEEGRIGLQRLESYPSPSPKEPLSKAMKGKSIIIPWYRFDAMIL